MPVRVIGAGLGCSDTELLDVLENAGIAPCYTTLSLNEPIQKHKSRSNARAQVPFFWDDVMAASKVDWRGTLNSYEAAVDWPCCMFYKELMEAFPEAKVVLAVYSDASIWYQSFKRLITMVRHTSDKRCQRVLDALVWRGMFQGLCDDQRHCLEVYEQHVAEVKRYVPAEKLLVYNVDKPNLDALYKFLSLSKRTPSSSADPLFIAESSVKEHITLRKLLFNQHVAAFLSLMGGFLVEYAWYRLLVS